VSKRVRHGELSRVVAGVRGAEKVVVVVLETLMMVKMGGRHWMKGTLFE